MARKSNTLIAMFFSTLFFNAAPVTAQTASPDMPIAQTVVVEIRQLRQDLRNIAVTVQRAQIVIYHLQAQGTAVDKAAQRLDEARNQCTQNQNQKDVTTEQISRVETTKRNSQNEPDRLAAEGVLAALRANLEAFTGQEQQCQAQQLEAENQFKVEQAKLNQFSEQLDQLDQLLVSQGSK
jgi:chromosome segregation ATPase